MRVLVAGLAFALGAGSPARAFSPQQIFMLLAAFDAFQSECSGAATAFSQWDAAALARLAARYGVDVNEAENARRITLFSRRMREGMDPMGVDHWCETIHAELEKILQGLGKS